MKQNRVFIVVLAALLSAIALTGCASGELAQDVEYTIEMSDFAFSPDKLDLKVGQTVTLNLVNVGTFEHELMIGREVVYSDGLPVAYGLDYFAGIAPVVEMEEHADDMDMHEDDEVEGEDHQDEAEEMDSHEDGEEEGEDHNDDADHDDAEEMDMHEDGEEEGEGHEGQHGFMVQLDPGQKASITFTVTESMLGEWEIGCLYGEASFHYTAGMVGSLTVTN